MLMGTVELDPNGHIILPAQLNEPRFSLPGSGLYANIADVAANFRWQSSSTLGLGIPFERALTPGERCLRRTCRQRWPSLLGCRPRGEMERRADPRWR